jgi:hypothetical protein
MQTSEDFCSSIELMEIWNLMPLPLGGEIPCLRNSKFCSCFKEHFGTKTHRTDCAILETFLQYVRKESLAYCIMSF